MGELQEKYMGKNWERFSKLADVELVVADTTLLAHLSTLAQHSEVVLDLVESKGTPGGAGKRINLAEPFVGKSTAGVLLLLKCFYQPQHVKRFMGESLEEDPSETPLHELLALAHYFQATALLAEFEDHLEGELVERLQPANLTKWVGTAERCGCTRLQRRLTLAVGKQLAEEHSAERVRELITELSPDSAAAIVANAWDELVAGRGGGGAGAAAAAALQGELEAARAEAAALQRELDAARAAAAAAGAAGAIGGDSSAAAAAEEEVARLTAQMEVLPRLFGQWLPKELVLVSMDSEGFVVEWTVPNFSSLEPQVLDSPGFGPGQAWKVRMFPRSSDGKSDAVGLFLTFTGAAAVMVKYAVTLVNQRDPMASRTMEAVSSFVPRSQEDTWGTPQFISRPELLDAGVGFSPMDTVKVRVSVGPPPAAAAQ